MDSRMVRTRKYKYRVLRLIVVFLLVSFLLPVSEAPTGRTEAFASLLSPIVGQLQLIIRKSHSTVTLYKGNTHIRTYHAVFGKGYREGDKLRLGDKRTPEGEFYICSMNHSKRFYKFMGLSYPGMKHADHGLRSGMISLAEYASIKKAIEERQPPPWGTRLGGAVGLHGRTPDAGNTRQQSVGTNWTDGCIALDNADLDEIYHVVSLGTPVTILP
jgi:murein L,D-transpeptidase YafK